MEDCTSRRCFLLLQFFVSLCPGAGRLACELYILLSCLLLTLMGGGMLTGMILVVLAAKHVIHPGRILYVALGVVVMMTFYASTIFGSFAFFADLSAYVSPQENYDYTIVHGCGIFGDQITPLLKSCVDKTLTLYRKSGKLLVLQPGNLLVYSHRRCIFVFAWNG